MRRDARERMYKRGRQHKEREVNTLKTHVTVCVRHNPDRVCLSAQAEHAQINFRLPNVFSMGNLGVQENRSRILIFGPTDLST